MEYEIKSYDWKGNFKQQITSIFSKLEFQEELDGGQGNLTLQFAGNLDDYKCSDIIEIRNSETGNMYSGIIEEINIVEFENASLLSITLYGVFTALNDVYYKSGGSKSFTKTDNIGNIIKNIIDSFNSDYGALVGETQILNTNLIRYTLDSIETGPSVSIEFNNSNCLEAIKKVLDNSGFNFFIGKDGVCYVKSKASQPVRFITFEKEIISIDRTLTKKDLVNKYYLSRVGDIEKIYNDNSSQIEFALKEKQESKTDILNESSQDTYGNNYILEHKDEENIANIKVKANSINLIPGNYISTLNSKNNLVEKQVTKIDIKKESWTLYLGNFISFGKTIVKGN